ncbi:odorant-binding protein 83ef [Haematobia irritans]|uniref:odorant-binding protein 83ef n=1 Tax=Haematobia irritans TaxID=7368 RepID=UPI003F5033F8
MISISIFLVAISILVQQISCDKENDVNSGILRQCLEDISHHNETGTERLLKKFSNYANWTEEEIPCFARCVAAEKGWFDIERHRWNKQKIVDDLGANLYNYCRYEFNRDFNNVCTFAFKGLKCLKQAELNVLVTYSHLLTCVKEKATSMSQLLEYYHFPAGERIPCLFNCFANKAQLYDANYQWIVKNWLKAFGPIRDETVNISICRISDEKRKTMDTCAWMYDEYNCWERLNYNTNGSVAYRRALRTLAHESKDK